MRHTPTLARTAVLSLLLALPATGQNGADTCDQAPLVGDGVHPFDTTGATASGVEPNSGMCEDFGQGNPASMNKDVWFEWTPGTNGDYRFSTCDDASYDTKLAVYSGTCAAPAAPRRTQTATASRTSAR